MNKAYNAINWKNEPSTSTAINETNLNKMDRAIDTIDNRVISLDSEKVSKEEGKSLVSNTDISKIGANETAIQTHISNKSNPHSVTKAQVGLGNVDNTSDVNKPISTAQQAEFDAINNNLDQLEYSDVAGGKNLFNYDEYIKNGRIVIFEVIGGKTLYRNGSIGSYSKWEVLDADGNKLSDFYGFTPTSPMVLPVNAKYIKCNGDVVFSDLYIGYDSDISYEPYIPSVKMLAEEVNAQNDSLGDYGLNNVFDGVKQGYITVSTGVESDIDKNCVKSIDKKSCKPNDKITIKTEKGMTWIGITFYKSDGTFLSGSEKTYSSKQGYEYTSTAPDNSAYYKYYVGISAEEVTPQTVGHIGVYVNNEIDELKNDLSDCRKKSDITTNETLIGTFNGKNYYRKLFTGIGGSGSSVTVNVGEKIEIYNYYGRAYTYGQSGASDVKYPIPNKNYYIDSQNASETSFQLTIPTSSDMRKVDLVIEYTKVDE